MIKFSKTSDFYTYVYVDPERNIPIYVGKGSGQRSEFHIKKLATNAQLRNRITTLKRKGLTPKIEILPAIDESSAFSEEIRLIAIHGRRNLNTGTLYNLTDGGEGAAGRRLSEETKHKISVANTNPSQESRAKMAAWERTAETRQKIGAKIRIARQNWSPEMIEQERVRRSIEGMKSETRTKMSISAKARPALECPHCGKIGKVPGIRKHHFEYCKAHLEMSK